MLLMCLSFRAPRIATDVDVLLHLLWHYYHHGHLHARTQCCAESCQQESAGWILLFCKRSCFVPFTVQYAGLWRAKVMLTFARVSIFTAFLQLMSHSKVRVEWCSNDVQMLSWNLLRSFCDAACVLVLVRQPGLWFNGSCTSELLRSRDLVQGLAMICHDEFYTLLLWSFPWLYMAFHGFPWLSMAVHGFPWLSIEIEVGASEAEELARPGCRVCTSVPLCSAVNTRLKSLNHEVLYKACQHEPNQSSFAVHWAERGSQMGEGSGSHWSHSRPAEGQHLRLQVIHCYPDADQIPTNLEECCS